MVERVAALFLFVAAVPAFAFGFVATSLWIMRRYQLAKDRTRIWLLFIVGQICLAILALYGVGALGLTLDRVASQRPGVIN